MRIAERALPRLLTRVSVHSIGMLHSSALLSAPGSPSSIQTPGAFLLGMVGVACLSFAASSAPLASQGPVTPTLLLDINRSPDLAPRDSRPGSVEAQGGTAWFRATTSATGDGLWRTDGTTAGTQVLVDVARPGFQRFGPARALANGALLLVGHTPASGTEMFVAAPGSTTVSLLGDIVPGPESSNPIGPVVLGSTGWFFAEDGTPGVEIWRTDGTAAGTVVDEDIAGPSFCRLFGVAGKLWIVEAPAGGGVLRVKSGPGVPARVLQPVPDLLAYEFLGGVNGLAVFVGESAAAASGRELWVSDGTTAGTRQLAELEPGPGSPTVVALGTSGGRLWFGARENRHGSELWVTDGTPAGTRLVVDLAPGYAHGVLLDATRALPFGGGLVFCGSDGATGYEPWFSDGTAAGTYRIRDVEPGSGSSSPKHFVEHAGQLWFGAWTTASGLELWSSDGTAAGTNQVVDLVPGADGSDAAPLASTSNGLLIAADDGQIGDEPWIVDPVTHQVRLLANLEPDGLTLGSGVGRLAVHDDFAFLTVGVGDPRPWVTDGTAAGTTSLGLGSRAPGGYGLLGSLSSGLLFVGANSATRDVELLLTDGTASGTRSLGRVPYIASHYPSTGAGYPILEDRLYFTTVDREIWSTDGTPSGTAPVAALAGVTHFIPLVAFDGLLFGVGADAASGTELWVSDLSASGTRRVADANPGVASSTPQLLLGFPGGVFFTAFSSTAGSEPWVSDGTPGGTRMLRDITPGAASSLPSQPAVLGDRVVFVIEGQSGGQELWITDGSPAGTTRLVSFPAPFRGRAVGQIEVAGDRAFVQVNTGDARFVDLWVTDGTVAGTRRVLASSSPGPRLVLGGVMRALTDQGYVNFPAWSARYGHELWISDGTAAGTRPFTDSNPGTAGSGALAAFRLGGQALFVADDGRTGTELHAAPLAAFGVPVAEPLGRGCGGASVRATGAPRVGGPSFDALFQASAPGRQALGLVADVRTVFRVPMPGCEIHLPNPIAIGAGTTDAQGLFRLTLSVPNQPALVGARFYLQAAIVKTNGPLFGTLEATEALELQIGR